jgi:hypothetical protein
MLMQSINRKPRLVKKISGTYSHLQDIITLRRGKNYLIFFSAVAETGSSTYNYVYMRVGSDTTSANFLMQQTFTLGTGVSASSGGNARLFQFSTEKYSTGYVYLNTKDVICTETIQRFVYYATAWYYANAITSVYYEGSDTGDITLYAVSDGTHNVNVKMEIYEV